MNFGSLIRFYWNHCIAITCVFKLGGVYMSISRRVKWNATTSILNIMASNYRSEFHFCFRDWSETHFCLSDQSETHFGSLKPWYWELKSLHFTSPDVRCSFKRRLSPFNYILETIALYLHVFLVFLHSRIKGIRNEKNSAWDLNLYPYNCISLEKTCEP